MKVRMVIASFLCALAMMFPGIKARAQGQEKTIKVQVYNFGETNIREFEILDKDYDFGQFGDEGYQDLNRAYNIHILAAKISISLHPDVMRISGRRLKLSKRAWQYGDVQKILSLLGELYFPTGGGKFVEMLPRKEGKAGIWTIPAPEGEILRLKKQ